VYVRYYTCSMIWWQEKNENETVCTK